MCIFCKWTAKGVLEQHEPLARASEDEHEDYLAVADTIGVNRSTARVIVARYVREGRIAERPDIVNENWILILSQINQELRPRLPKKFSAGSRVIMYAA